MGQLFNIRDCSGPVINKATGEQLCTLCDLLRLVDNVKNILVAMLGVIVGIMIIYGAFVIIFSAGNPGEFKRGRDIIMYAFIGAAIVLSAYIIVDTIFKFFAPGNTGGLGPWNRIQCR